MITDLGGMQQVVAFTFLLTFFGMAAAAGYLIVERSQVAPSYRISVSLAGLICAIAAGNYFYMRELYVAGAVSGTGVFPTEFRYIDWFLTVPLMLAQFPLHLGMGRRGRMFMVWLIGCSLLMLAAGYLGEINADDPTLHLGLWLVGCGFGVAIFVPLVIALRAMPATTPPDVARTVRAMTVLVLVGWAVYPLGYLQPALGFSPDMRELIYNVADLVNKVGLGLLLFIGGRAALRGEAATAEPPDVLDRLDADRLAAERRGSDRPEVDLLTMSLDDAQHEPVALSATDSLLAGRR